MAALSGMNEICLHVKRSAPTVLDWVRAYGFPARKLNGAWESDTELVDKWRKGIISAEPNEGTTTMTKQPVMTRKTGRRK